MNIKRLNQQLETILQQLVFNSSIDQRNRGVVGRMWAKNVKHTNSLAYCRMINAVFNNLNHIDNLYQTKYSKTHRNSKLSDITTELDYKKALIYLSVINAILFSDTRTFKDELKSLWPKETENAEKAKKQTGSEIDSNAEKTKKQSSSEIGSIDKRSTLQKEVIKEYYNFIENRKYQKSDFSNNIEKHSTGTMIVTNTTDGIEFYTKNKSRNDREPDMRFCDFLQSNILNVIYQAFTSKNTQLLQSAINIIYTNSFNKLQTDSKQSGQLKKISKQCDWNRRF